mgnify:CR=1 FL=1
MINLKYRPPEEMKDSGVEWVGSIPQGWGLIPNKYIAEINTGSRDTQDSVDDGKYPFYVRSKKVERIDSYSFDGEAILTPGDGDIGGIFHYVNGRFDFHQRVYKYSDFKNYHGKFLYYYLKVLLKRKVMGLSAKSTVDSLRMPMLLNFECVSNEVQEQHKIADFLDEKTGYFDSIISKKEKLIEKLEEAKKSLISEVVTGKVKIVDGQMVERSPEEMKDSGVEWLGYIPRNWTFRKTSHDYEIRLGKMLQTTKKRSTDTLEEYLCTINVDWAGLKLDEVKQMWFSVKDKQQYLVKNGDLIVNEGGDAGKAVMVDGLSGDMYIQNAVHRVRPKGASKAKALYYWLFFLKSIEYIELICNKATIMHFTVEKFRNLPFLGQDYFEQKRMIDLLDARVPKINSIINKQRKIIEKIKQAKQSLIYEAVTGKIDLRDWEIKQEGE